MCRDDRGGWLPSSSIDKHKIVGKDFRGLPIVHIGKGRPNMKVVKQLEQSPDVHNLVSCCPPALDTGNDNSTFATGVACVEERDVDREEDKDPADEPLPTHPRTSIRLHQKRSRLKKGTVASLDSEVCDNGDVQVNKDDSLAASSKRESKPYCTDCCLQFGSSAPYRRHLVSPDCKGFALRCNFCQRVFSQSTELEAHEMHGCYQQICVTGAGYGQDWSSLRFRCSICGKGFRREEEITPHARESHSSAPALQCRLCQRSFHELRALRNHCNRHHIKLKFTCQVCMRQLSSSQTLLSHSKLCHSHDRPVHKCPLCAKSLVTKGSLKHHMSSMHENNRPHKCEYCDKSFVTKYALTVHEKTHQGTRDFTCGICGASFIQKVRLQEHIRAHSGTRNFHCSVCNKSFSSKKDLTSHAKIHSKVKSYICEHCSKAYSQVQSLKKHLSTHSSLPQVFKCQFCVKSFNSTGAVYKHCRLLHKDRLTAYCSLCCLSFVSEADLNRHNHYKHIAMYNGRAEEKSFLSSTTEVTENIVYRETADESESSASYQCLCGETFADVNKITLHMQKHPGGRSPDEQKHPGERSPDAETLSCSPIAVDASLISPEGNLIEQIVATTSAHADLQCIKEGAVRHVEADSITSTAVAVPGLLYDSRTTSQSRTQVFQLSTTATGLTEIQQLFHET
ncbi:zinc finger protein 260-like [Watersipora subatra]|uniref:zinc finger protein 260-like n=1 Tax=Watersipora subatra TaxID=2589382 RepID=UPI00355C3FAE